MATWDVLNATRYIIKRVNHIEDLLGRMNENGRKLVDSFDDCQTNSNHKLPLMLRANRSSLGIPAVYRWYWRGFVEYLRWRECHWCRSQHPHPLHCDFLLSTSTSTEVFDRHSPSPKLSTCVQCYLHILCNHHLKVTHISFSVLTTSLKLSQQ